MPKDYAVVTGLPSLLMYLKLLEIVGIIVGTKLDVEEELDLPAGRGQDRDNRRGIERRARLATSIAYNFPVLSAGSGDGADAAFAIPTTAFTSPVW